MNRFIRDFLIGLVVAAVAVGLTYGLASVDREQGVGEPNTCGNQLMRGNWPFGESRCAAAVYEPGHTIAVVCLLGALGLVLLGATWGYAASRSRRSHGSNAEDFPGGVPDVMQGDADHPFEAPSLMESTVLDAVAEAKLDLAAGRRAIVTHDLLQQEAARLREIDVLSTDPSRFYAMTYADRLPILESELELWTALVGTLAYWGNTQTDRWWTDHISQFGSIPAMNGNYAAIATLAAPAVLSIYTGGAAAVAARRWELVAQLITGFPIRGQHSSEEGPASAIYGPAHIYAASAWPSEDLARLVVPVLGQTVGLGHGSAADAWERFEYLVYAANTSRLKQDLPSYLARPFPYLQIEDNRAEDRRKMTPSARAFFNDGKDPIILELLSHGLFRGDRRIALLSMDTADSVISEQVIRSEMSMAGGTADYYVHSERRYPVVREG